MAKATGVNPIYGCLDCGKQIAMCAKCPHCGSEKVAAMLVIEVITSLLAEREQYRTAFEKLYSVFNCAAKGSEAETTAALASLHKFMDDANTAWANQVKGG